MNPARFRPALALLALVSLIATRAARAASDLDPPAKRQAVVVLAEKLSKPEELAALPADLVVPFNPPGFGAAARGPAAGAATPGVPGAPGAAPAAPAVPTTDRQMLEAITSRIVPSGTVMLGDEFFLVFGKQRLRVGDKFTVSYGGQDYVLELTGIDRTTFTLRLNRDEITRPIKPAKSS